MRLPIRASGGGTRSSAAWRSGASPSWPWRSPPSSEISPRRNAANSLHADRLHHRQLRVEAARERALRPPRARPRRPSGRTAPRSAGRGSARSGSSTKRSASSHRRAAAAVGVCCRSVRSGARSPQALPARAACAAGRSAGSLRPTAGSRSTRAACSAATPSVCKPRRPARADLRRDRRRRGQPLGQRLEIEAGAADDDRQRVRRSRFARAPVSTSREPGADGIAHARRAHGRRGGAARALRRLGSAARSARAARHRPAWNRR